MKFQKYKLVILLTMLIAGFVEAAQCQVEGETAHRFMRAGWKSGGVEVFDKNGNTEWLYADDGELSDAWILPDGGAVFSFSRRKEDEAGVARLDNRQQLVWEYRVQKGRDNHSCQPLPHGGFLVGETAPDGAWMVELDRMGKELKRVKVLESTADFHHAFRQVRKTPQGTYLGTIMKENKTYEWDGSGNLLRTFPNGVYVAIRLPNGNTLTGGKDAGPGSGPVVEFDRRGEVVWRLDAKDLPFQMNMVCGLQRLPNGNTVVSNVWHGKHTDKSAPMLYEVTPDKKVVWELYTAGGQMGNLQILDVSGDVHEGNVFK